MTSSRFISALLLTAAVTGRAFSNNQFHGNELQAIKDLNQNRNIQDLSPSDASSMIRSDTLNRAYDEEKRGEVDIQDVIEGSPNLDKIDVDFSGYHKPILEISTSAARDSDVVIPIADTLHQLSPRKDAEIHITYDKKRQQERGKPYSFFSFKESGVAMVMKKQHIYLKKGNQKVKLRIYDGNIDSDKNEISPSERQNFVTADRERRLDKNRAKQKAKPGKSQQNSEDPKEEGYSIYDTASLIVAAAVASLSLALTAPRNNKKEKRRGPPKAAIINAQADNNKKLALETPEPEYMNI